MSASDLSREKRDGYKNENNLNGFRFSNNIFKKILAVKQWAMYKRMQE